MFPEGVMDMYLKYEDSEYYSNHESEPGLFKEQEEDYIGQEDVPVLASNILEHSKVPKTEEFLPQQMASEKIDSSKSPSNSTHNFSEPK